MNEKYLTVSEANETLTRYFSEVKQDLPGDPGLREKAFSHFLKTGLPNRRIEEFKYTDLSASLKSLPSFGSSPSSDLINDLVSMPSVLNKVDAYRIDFVNGSLVTNIGSLRQIVPDYIRIDALSDFLNEEGTDLSLTGQIKGVQENPLYALNSAFMKEGIVIRIKAGAKPENPLHFRFFYSDQAVMSAIRCLVLIEKGASAQIIESLEGKGVAQHFLNDVMEIQLKEDAEVSHIRLNDQNRNAIILSTLSCSVGQNSVFRTWNIASGGSLSRHQLFGAYHGEGAEIYANGVQMVRDRQIIDTTLQMDHAEPGGISRELFKTVVQDQAAGVFQGKIIVEPFAQKTDGQMMSAALLLSEQSAMNNKPELEIYANDVVCAHGATCGQLDDELLFYLMARGLPRTEAESLMIQAFLNEALENINNEELKEALENHIVQWLETRT